MTTGPSVPPPASTGAPPRDASTVVVAREPVGAAGPLEIFFVKRHDRSGFLGGAVVFPGGKVDEEDLSPAWLDVSTPLTRRADELDVHVARARGLAVAALREVLEEAAILPAAPRDLDDAEVLELRRTTAGAAALRAALLASGSKLDLARLAALGRWITPVAEPRRYDTRFYLLSLPPGQRGTHDAHETTESFWGTAAGALSRWERGEIFLAPPTVYFLELLRAATTLEEAFALAGTQPLTAVEPCFVTGGDAVLLTLPGDPLHPAGGPPLGPGAPTRFVLSGGRLVPGRAP